MCFLGETSIDSNESKRKTASPAVSLLPSLTLCVCVAGRAMSQVLVCRTESEKKGNTNKDAPRL